MGFYSEDIAQQAIEDIRKILGNISMTIDYEIQDHGEFLLLIVRLSETPKKADIRTWHRRLKEYFSKAFPNSVEGYTWMITLHHNGSMLESVTDDIRLS